MIKISANNEVELSGEANGIYFVVYKDSISPLTPSTEIALIEACDKIAALEARLKEAEAAFRSIESFPHYAYGDNEAACSMVAIAAAWLKEAQA